MGISYKNKCAGFDGVNGTFISVPHAATLEAVDKFWAEAIVYLPALPADYHTIFARRYAGYSAGDGYSLHQRGGTLYFFIRNGANTTYGVATKSITTGWSQVDAVFDAGVLTAHVNAVAGTPVDYSGSWTTMYDSPYALHMGASGGTGIYFKLTGYIAELRIYKRIPASGEISDNYNGGNFVRRPKNLNDLMIWLALNEGAGTKVIDRTGNNHVGTLNGNVTWEDIPLPRPRFPMQRRG